MSTRSRLEGKVAVITGAANGIGYAASKLFAEEGAKVLLVDISEDGLKKAVQSIAGDGISYVTADVSIPEEVQKYVQTAVEKYGRIDVFISNAGIEGDVKPIPDYPIEIFDKVMAINVRGMFLGLKCVIPVMEKGGGGSIVITSSVSARVGLPGTAPYVMSKHAVSGLMKNAALEFASKGIRVSTVNPGPVETRLMYSIEDGIAPGEGEKVRANIISNIAMGRYVLPSEVAQMMLFLASDESKMCTGSEYFVDGGLCAI